jgi:hypothetical protein
MISETKLNKLNKFLAGEMRNAGTTNDAIRTKARRKKIS